MAKDKKTPDHGDGEQKKKPTQKVDHTARLQKEAENDYLMTGLSDYGFWCDQVKKEHAAHKQDHRSFRRGRIWC
jgi:cyanobactin cluster PatC/TenC/TruC protein